MKLLISDSDQISNPFVEKIKCAKSILPLEKMLEQLKDWDRCVAEKRCPFHDDNSPSFSVFVKEDDQYWKCHAGCGAGDQITYLEHKFNLSRAEAIKLFLEMTGVGANTEGGYYE